MENRLRKDIGLSVAMSLVIGTVIGSGIFMKPGTVIEAAGSTTMALVVWVIGGLITLAGGLTIAEVSTQIPKTGGLYVYLEETFGKMVGYLSGWVQTVLYGPAIIGTLGLYFGSLFCGLFGLDSAWKLGVGIVSVLFLGIMNSMGTRYGGFIQTVATVGKLIPIALIIVFGLLKGEAGAVESTFSSTEVNIGAAILATLFAYDGWILVGTVAGEMKNPGKQLPRAIIGGILVVMAAYLLVNIALFQVLSAEQIVSLGENSAGTAAGILFGDLGGKLISVGILVSIFGCLNGKLMTFPRIPFAMAERGQLPGSKWLAKVSKQARTPMNATLMQVGLALALMIVWNPDRLSDIAIFSVQLSYLLAFAAVFVLRKRNAGKERIYSVPLYPVIPILAMVGALYVMISTIISNPTDTLFALGLTFIGLPLYWVLNRKVA